MMRALLLLAAVAVPTAVGQQVCCLAVPACKAGYKRLEGNRCRWFDLIRGRCYYESLCCKRIACEKVDELQVGDVCYQFCEAGDCAPINRRDECPKGTECVSDGTIGFNSRSTCQAPVPPTPTQKPLKEGDVCYQFCEAGDCAPINRRDECPKGTKCVSDGTIGFNSRLTCQAPAPPTPTQKPLKEGDVCYQFCEAGDCAPINRRDECPKGTECVADGTIGFNSRSTCQAPVPPTPTQKPLKKGDVCYQFCETGSCLFVNRRGDCPKGTECVDAPGIGFNSFATCE